MTRRTPTYFTRSKKKEEQKAMYSQLEDSGEEIGAAALFGSPTGAIKKQGMAQSKEITPAKISTCNSPATPPTALHVQNRVLVDEHDPNRDGHWGRTHSPNPPTALHVQNRVLVDEHDPNRDGQWGRTHSPNPGLSLLYHNPPQNKKITNNNIINNFNNVDVEKTNDNSFRDRGKRNTTVFPHVCSIENVDKEVCEIKIIGLKAADDSKTIFYVVSISQPAQWWPMQAYGISCFKYATVISYNQINKAKRNNDSDYVPGLSSELGNTSGRELDPSYEDTQITQSSKKVHILSNVLLVAPASVNQADLNTPNYSNVEEEDCTGNRQKNVSDIEPEEIEFNSVQVFIRENILQKIIDKAVEKAESKLYTKIREIRKRTTS
ncbi:unnamed protein product [Brassicogethes aeneus]|uniref:Uncharacterized protein n=1 Tax=Brassicogethes aeneus TaxID=1431903 RepID=A0A9P0BEZ5_BRAAE|nr:unnamed protein product [Brassicogethes aeneus]